MQTGMFPPDYNRVIDAKYNEKINNAKKLHEGRLYIIERSRPKNVQTSNVPMAIMVGFFGGMVSCACAGAQADSQDVGFLTWLIVGIISIVIGIMSDLNKKSNFANVDYRIRKENQFLEEEIAKIRDESNDEKEQYLCEFEKKAQSLSVQFAESILAREVIDWMTNGFCKTIDNSARSKHIEKIVVPFVFNTYKNKIVCNLGTYDFEIKRCRELINPIEQAALARAIASAIQLNIIMKYPKDQSGTSVFIEISYGYTSEYVGTTIKYVAPNGYYKALRNW